jgi:trigger factor
MEFQIEKIDSANSVVEFTLQNEDVIKVSDKIARDMAKNIDLQGFRKGKVPVKIVKQRFEKDIKDNAYSDLFRETVDSALKDLELDKDKLIGDPQVVRFEELDNGNVDVEVQISSKPVIDLGDYRAYIPEVDIITISDDEVKAKITSIAEPFKPLISVSEDKEVENGDIAVIDFEGFIDGEAFEGGQGENYELEIGSNSFIPGFEEQIIGMKKGDTKDISVKFPDDYQSSELAGKDSIFKITLHDIKQKGELVLDDELAKKILGDREDSNFDELFKLIKDNLINEKKGKYYQDNLRTTFVEKLLENITVDIPNNILEEEINNALNVKAGVMSKDELEDLKNDKEKLEQLATELKPEAMKSVQVTFLIDALAKDNDIDVTDAEISQVIYDEALQAGQNPMDVLKFYQENGYTATIKMSMIESKVLTKLFDEKVGQ